MDSFREEVVRVVRDILAPLIRADGGDVYLLRADHQEVELHLAGRYAGSPGLTLTTRRVIEPVILTIAPTVRVVVTSGALVPPGAEPLEDVPTEQESGP
jgi:Fe-S cluster biogenesis protein NfuA